MDRNKIYNEDCIETINNRLKPKSLDIVITSPPFISEWKSRQDYKDWLVNIFSSLRNVLKDDGVILINMSYNVDYPSLPYEFITQIEKETTLRLVDTIIWKKKTGVPFPANKYRLSRVCEFVFVLTKKDSMNSYTNNRRIKSVSEKTGQVYYDVVYNYIEAPNNDGANTLNKSSFSTDLVVELLDIYCNGEEKRTIYDPFMGIGTTALGCIKYDDGKHKIEYFGSEISKEQCIYAEKKILSLKSKSDAVQLSLFSDEDDIIWNINE